VPCIDVSRCACTTIAQIPCRLGPMPRTAKELAGAAVHMTYEVNMLLFASRYIDGWYSAVGPEERLTNMALESFLLHFRNLRTFLCPKLQVTKPDDITGPDFVGLGHKDDAINSARFPMDEATSLNKMLAHLSYSRPTYIAGGLYDWHVPRRTLDVLNGFKEFLAKLDPGTRKWPPVEAEIDDRLQRLAGFAKDL
jgi:hypothetical protein